MPNRVHAATVVSVSDIVLAGNALNAQPTPGGQRLRAFRASPAVFHIDAMYVYLFKLKNRTNTK